MAVVITGTSITAPDGAIDAADLTGTLPALDGSAITDLDAANLTGTLPALNGSALTNLAAANLTGALPAIDGSALTGVGASTDFGGVGTYCFAKSSGTSTKFLSNSTYAGSALRAAGISVQSSSAYWVNGADDNSGLSGTWRAMGENDHSSSSWYSMTLFVRIS